MLTAASARACQLDRAAAGQPERLAEQRVDRQMDGVRSREPGGSQVARREQVGRAAVGHEAALAAGCDDDADPAGPCAGATRHTGGHAIGPDRLDEGPPRRVATDRRDQRRSAPRAGRASEPCWPPSRPARARRVPARPSRTRARGPAQAPHRASGRRGRRSVRDRRRSIVRPARVGPVRSAGTPRSGRTCRAPGSWQGRHPRRIAGPRLQWPDRRHAQTQARTPIDGAHPMTVATDLDQLAIDTIRTLSIDAVQKANSGHPGAPMGAAPMAYVLWTRFLRHAPTQPGLARPRPLRAERRPRQHAALLAPPPDRLRGLARGPRVLPPVGQHHAGPPGIRPDAGRRGDHRPARPGLRQRRRDGHRRAPAGGRVQPTRPRHRRPPDLRHRLGRRPPGGDRLGGGQPGRPPAARAS